MRKPGKIGNLFLGIFLTPYFFTLIFLAVLLFIAPPIYKNYYQRYAVDREIADLRKQIAGLESSNSDLEKLKDYLSSAQYAEREARLNLGLKKPGEQVAVIEKTGAAEAGAGDDRSAAENKNSNPVKWWNYFFGR